MGLRSISYQTDQVHKHGGSGCHLMILLGPPMQKRTRSFSAQTHLFVVFLLVFIAFFMSNIRTIMQPAQAVLTSLEFLWLLFCSRGGGPVVLKSTAEATEKSLTHKHTACCFSYSHYCPNSIGSHGSHGGMFSLWIYFYHPSCLVLNVRRFGESSFLTRGLEERCCHQTIKILRHDIVIWLKVLPHCSLLNSTA